MSLLDWSFLDPVGRAVIATIETVISLSAITSLLSLSAALVATWVMQVTTHQAGLDSSIARLALAQRIALAALAIFLMLNAVTPFITPGTKVAIKSMRKSARPPVSKQRIAEAGADGEHGPFVDVPHEWHFAQSLYHGVVVHHN